METRVRFAPSPTGQVHIGNIRTAIFNWLFARHSKGKFLLRIEDTDLERSTQEAITKLLECMAWLQLDYDEEALYQTSLRGDHDAAAERLLSQGLAYKGKADEEGRAPVIFRMPFDCEASEFIRSAGEVTVDLHTESKLKIAHDGVEFFTVSKKGKAVENRGCLAGFKDLKVYDSANSVIFDLTQQLEAIKNGECVEVSGGMKMSFTRREVVYNDLIKGELAKPLDSMKDLVIVRSDSSPVFHLANVCDDIKQGITHVIRGDDHVENTYRHIMLYQALDAQLPQFAHLPMIVNQAGKPYSKRDGDAFVGDFQAKGFLPHALFNYLSLLGWSPGNDQEKLTIDEMVAAFTLDRVKSSPAQFDINKLRNLNGLYVAELPAAEFIVLAKKFASEYDWFATADQEKFEQVAQLMQSRTKAMTDIATWSYFFAAGFEYSGKQFRKQLGNDINRQALAELAGIWGEDIEFTPENIAGNIAAIEAKFGLNSGKLFPAIRIAVTGAAGGADLLQTLTIIGANSCSTRIHNALSAHEATVAAG